MTDAALRISTPCQRGGRSDRVVAMAAPLVRHSRTLARMAPTLAPTRRLGELHVAPDLVGMAGFEPAASCSQSRRANQAAPHPVAHEAYRLRAGLRRAQSVGACTPGQPTPPVPRRHRGTRYATAWRPSRPRGRSSMAEPQPSKLVMRVRFPSPALTVSRSHRHPLACQGCVTWPLYALRQAGRPS